MARITTIRKQAFKKNTILSSFRKTGLIPYDPSIVLNKLQEAGKDSRATPEPPPLSNPSTPKRLPKEFFFTTPITLKQKTLCRSINQLRLFTLVSKGYTRKICEGQFGKGRVRRLAEDELKGVRKAEMERATRRKSTNRVVQKGGVITVGKARQDIASRKQNEVLVANRALIRAQKAAHQAVVGPWLNLLKEGNAIRMNVKKDTKARKQALVLLFRELKEFVKKGKFSDTVMGWRLGPGLVGGL